MVETQSAERLATLLPALRRAVSQLGDVRQEWLARWEKNKAKCGTLEGIARVLELATKLARLAAGMPTEVKEVNTTMKATIDVDWEIAIRKAYEAKPQPNSPPATVSVEPKAETIVDAEEIKP